MGLTRGQWLALLAFVGSTSLGLFLFASLHRPDSAPFFGDADYKWRQIQDLLTLGPFDISCRYPARLLDPDLRLFTDSNPVVNAGGRCYYLYPYGLSFLFAPAVWLAGKAGVFALQQMLSAGILILMIVLGRRLSLSAPQILVSLVLFRLGTGNLLQGVDLEEHTASTAVYLTACVIALFARTHISLFLGGMLAGLGFLLRPELAILGPALPLSLYWANRSEQSSFAKRSWISFALGLALCLGLLSFLNYMAVGHPLGIKAFDPLHAVDWNTRAPGILRNLFFHPRFVTNGLLFHMPLLALLLVYARARNRREASGALRFFLVQVAVCLPVLLVVSPHLPTAAAGFRFAAFLYPVMILLVVRLLPSVREQPVWGTLGLLAAGVSVIVSIGLFAVGLAIDRGFRQMHATLRDHRTPVIIVRDQFAQQPIATLFFESQVVFAAENHEVLRIIGAARARGLGEVLVVRHSLAGGGPLLPKGMEGSSGLRPLKTRYLEMVRVR